MNNMVLQIKFVTSSFILIKKKDINGIVIMLSFCLLSCYIFQIHFHLKMHFLLKMFYILNYYSSIKLKPYSLNVIFLKIAIL